MKTYNLTHKEQLRCPVTINFEVGGKPNFWLYPIDNFHMEIAKDAQLKTKIVLYFLCLAKPIAHLYELPAHEAEYDMIDKALAEKEREDRDNREKAALRDALLQRANSKSIQHRPAYENGHGEPGNKLPSIMPSQKMATSHQSLKKLPAKGVKEWWEKYNFSNPVLIRYKFDNKYEITGTRLGQPFYVGPTSPSSTSRQPWVC